MGDRWVTLAGALGALFVVAMLFYQPGEQRREPRPTTIETSANGYQALHDWIAQSGVTVHSVRRRFKDFLELQPTPETGNLLIALMPHAREQRHSEHRAIRQWVRDGNTLLLLVAMHDTPAWQLETFSFLEGDVEHLIGVEFYVDHDEDAEESEKGEEAEEGGERTAFQGADLRDVLTEPAARRMLPFKQHPLMQGVEELRVYSDAYASEWLADFSGSSELAIELAHDADTGVATLWEMSYGDGRIMLSSTAGLFSNRMLKEADNARLFSNLLAWHLAADGVVLFDDYHQGLSEVYDPEAFFGDSRLHVTLLFLVALWLFYLLGSTARLGPVRAHPSQTGQSALVGATAVLMSRKLSDADSGRALIDLWLRQLRAAGRLPPNAGGEPPWEALLDMPLTDPDVVAEIREQYGALGRGQAVDLVKLHNNIQTLKGNLS